jgi:hypothetical protein
VAAASRVHGSRALDQYKDLMCFQSVGDSKRNHYHQPISYIVKVDIVVVMPDHGQGSFRVVKVISVMQMIVSRLQLFGLGEIECEGQHPSELLRYQFLLLLNSALQTKDQL